MTLDAVLSAVEKDASVFVKLAPALPQAIGVYKAYKSATTEAAQLAAIGQGLQLASKQGVTLDEVATLVSEIASASA